MTTATTDKLVPHASTPTDEPTAPPGEGLRDLTGQELKLVAGGWGLSLGNGFDWVDYGKAVLGGLVSGAGGGLNGAVSGAAQGGINYIIHHPPALQ